MNSGNAEQGGLRQYILLVRSADVELDRLIEESGKRIHRTYMETFSGFGAFTMFVLRLAGDWQCAVRYMGPEESKTWLEREIQRAAPGAETLTLEVTEDITHVF